MRHRPFVVTAALALGLGLSGCESLPDMPDWFNTKKPLVGERRAVFPEGVPGVAHGVPPELHQGYQPPPEPTVAEAPPVKPKPKPKPRPKQAAAPPQQRPAAVTVQPSGQAQQSGAQAPWPSPRQTASQPAQSPFPDPPPR